MDNRIAGLLIAVVSLFFLWLYDTGRWKRISPILKGEIPTEQLQKLSYNPTTGNYEISARDATGLISGLISTIQNQERSQASGAFGSSDINRSLCYYYPESCGGGYGGGVYDANGNPIVQPSGQKSGDDFLKQVISIFGSVFGSIFKF